MVVTSVDAYNITLLDESKFYSRKAFNFKLWIVALILKIDGYYYTLKFFLVLSEILNKRYSTNMSIENDEIINEISKKFKDIIKKILLLI